MSKKTKNSMVYLLISFLPVRKDNTGQYKFSFANFFIQSFSILLFCGTVYKWFYLKNIESTEIIGICGYIFGSGFLLNQAKGKEQDLSDGKPPIEGGAEHLFDDKEDKKR